MKLSLETLVMKKIKMNLQFRFQKLRNNEKH